MALAIVLAAVVGQLSPSLGFEFRAMDDHEILEMLGPDDRMGPAEVLPAAHYYAWVRDPRLRPLYYVLRVVETFLLGAEPLAWHASRLLLAALCAAFLHSALTVLLPAAEAALVTLIFFSGRQNEIWIHLGPAETYGAVIVSIGAWCLSRLARPSPRAAWLLIGLLMLHLAGYVKESFIPLAPGALALLLLLRWCLPRTSAVGQLARGWLPAATLLLAPLAAVQVTLVLLGLRAHGHVYSRPFSPLDVPDRAVQSLYRYAAYSGWPAILLCAAAALWQARDRGRNRFWGELTWPAALVLLFLGPQWVIYNGEAMDGRYLVPGTLCVVLTCAWAFHVLQRKDVAKPQLRRLRQAAFAVSAVMILIWQVRIARATLADVDATRRFQTSIAAIRAAAAARPGRPVILVPLDTRDYENVFAVSTYLALPETQALYLQPAPPRKQGSLLDEKLAADLAAIARHGGHGFAPAPILGTLGGACLEVLFSGQQAPGLCQESRRVALD